MPKPRILIVDDAVVVRQVLSRLIADDPDLELAGTAANGRIAIEKLGKLAPDLIILDWEMPEMGGYETLVALRKTHPQLPVVLFSTLASRGSPQTLEAIALGVSAYVRKPKTLGGAEAALEYLRRELLPPVRALCRLDDTVEPVRAAIPPSSFPSDENNSSTTLLRPHQSAPRRSPRQAPPAQVDVVAVGVSTGGPNALSALIPSLPEHFPAPVLIVQHMPSPFIRTLAERLDARSALKVREAVEGEPLAPGLVLFAPGDRHLVAAREGTTVRVRLLETPPENSCRPSADVLFRSVAETYGKNALAVVMTGMGQDGLRGCEQIRAVGGSIVVQDEATSIVWGMPGQVAKAGLADQILPLEDMAPRIVRRVLESRLSRSSG
ncbi:MAG TPA: chemotaxis response regulator protein-glutamate methylesterase [Isosphaeraceae bacterium]|nr:chemotaxis response regulator protein-glutamate methylesterase [Isosphaeraceae bacterium]